MPKGVEARDCQIDLTGWSARPVAHFYLTLTEMAAAENTIITDVADWNLNASHLPFYFSAKVVLCSSVID